MSRLDLYDALKKLFPHFSEDGITKLIDFIEDNFIAKEQNG